MSSSSFRYPLAAVLFAAAALALGACGGDEATSSTTGTAEVASHPDLDRYCELVTELDQNSADVFNALGASGVPTNEQLAAAQLQVLEDNADLIDELTAAAPAEIRDDFDLSLESARKRAEEADASEPPTDVAEANVRLLKFRRENCPKPAAGN